MKISGLAPLPSCQNFTSSVWSHIALFRSYFSGHTFDVVLLRPEKKFLTSILGRKGGGANPKKITQYSPPGGLRIPAKTRKKVLIWPPGGGKPLTTRRDQSNHIAFLPNAINWQIPGRAPTRGHHPPLSTRGPNSLEIAKFSTRS